MKPELSDIETMEKMIQVWGYLSKHPHADKAEAYQVLNLSPDQNNCPLCEKVAYFEKEELKFTCESCLLADFWPGRCFWGRAAQAHVHWISTAYIRWVRGYGTDKAADAALEILEASKRKLEELINQGGRIE